MEAVHICTHLPELAWERENLLCSDETEKNEFSSARCAAVVIMLPRGFLGMGKWGTYIGLRCMSTQRWSPHSRLHQKPTHPPRHSTSSIMLWLHPPGHPPPAHLARLLLTFFPWLACSSPTCRISGDDKPCIRHQRRAHICKNLGSVAFSR